MAKKKSNKQPWTIPLVEREALYNGVNPSADFGIGSFISQGLGYLGGIRTGQGMNEDEARWAAYLGLPYDKEYAPDTKIRFEHDKDYPDRQYQGLSKRAKNEIRKEVIPEAKRIKDEYGKEWIQVLDERGIFGNDSTIYHPRETYTGDLGKFGIREVGNSGIYEIGDKYDFPSWVPVPDRNEGTELMIRDTIWSDRANPKLYNKEIIKRKNKHSIGGLLGKLGSWNQSATEGLFKHKDPTAGGLTKFGQFAQGFGINSGNIGGIANTAATAIGGLLAGKNKTGVGSAMQTIGSLASNIPGVGGLIGAGVNLLGGITNAAFGSNINKEFVNQTENQANQVGQYISGASDNASLLADWNNMSLMQTIDKSDVGSDGWFSDKASDETDRLNDLAKEANAKALASITNTAENIDKQNDLMMMANYNAYGGGIHIKPSKKGTFTAAAKKRGMGVQEFASKVLANKEDYSSAMVKKANFARNASKWKHDDGGPMDVSKKDIYRPTIKRVQGLSISEPYFEEDKIRSSQGSFQEVLENSTNEASDFMSKWYAGRKETGKFDEELAFIEDRAKIPTLVFGNNTKTGAASYKGTPTFAKIDVNPLYQKTLWGEEGKHRSDYVSRLIHEMAHNYSMFDKYGYNTDKSHEVSPTLKKLQAYMGDSFRMFPLTSGDTENAVEYYPRLMQMREAMGADPKRTNYTEKELNYWLNKFGLPTGERGVWMMNNLVQNDNKDSGIPMRLNPADTGLEVNKSMLSAYGGKLHKFADGGELFTNGVTTIGNGGTHEQNPYEGVQMGVDPQGIPNLVEEGEVIYDDYVFSNRLRVPKEVRQKYKLRGVTFAECAKWIQKESEERPNDPISKNGLNALMQMLMNEQEMIRAKKERNKYANGGRIANKFYDAGPLDIIENPYDTYRESNDDYSKWFTLGSNNKVSSYSDAYKNLIFTADMARAYAKNNPNDESVKSFLSKGNKLEDLTDEDVLEGSLDGKLGWLHRARANAAKSLDYIDESKLPSSADVDRTIRGLFGEPILNRNNTKVKDVPIVIEDDVDEEPLPAYTGSTSVSTGLESPVKDNWMRKAKTLVHGVGTFADLFSKPDYSFADRIANVNTTPAMVGYTPVGNYLKYIPFDRDNYINKLNADTAATRRGVVNTSGGNRAAAMAGLLAADYNYGNQLGDLARQAEEYNLAQRQKVEEFNRGTNMANSEMGLKAAMANAESRNQATKLRLSQAAQVAAMRQAAKLAHDTRVSNNINTFLDDLEGLGIEKWNKEWLNKLAKDGVFKIDSEGNYISTKPELSKAKGGKIRTKKKKGFTYG